MRPCSLIWSSSNPFLPLPFTLLSLLDIWLEWLEDEEAQAGLVIRLEDFERLQGLFRQATSDYLSIDIYLKWASFLERVLVESLEAAQNGSMNASPSVSFDLVRQFYESTIEVTQHHLARAGEVWERYRAFEDLVAAAEAISTPDAPVLRKRALFHRELAHPHLNLAKVFADTYVPWETTVGDQVTPLSEAEKQQARAVLEQSWAAVEARLAFEIELQEVEEQYAEKLEPDYTRLDAIRKYINFETSQAVPSPGRIRCLYERVLAMYYYVLDLWQAYTQYLLKAPREVSKHQSFDDAIAVLRRAIRNYPYTHHMWCKLFLTLEQRAQLPDFQEVAEATRREITETFEKALQAGLQSGAELLLVYKQLLDYRVRSVTNWSDVAQVTSVIALLESAVTYFDSYLPDQVFELEKYWVNVVWTKMQDESQVREVLGMSVRRRATSSETWLRFIAFELGQCSPPHPENARSLFKRAFASDLDAPDYLYSQWLDFERAYGDLESFVFAAEKIEKKQREHALKLASRDASRHTALADADKELGSRKGGNTHKGQQRRQKKKAFVQKEMREPQAAKRSKPSEEGAIQAPSDHSALYKSNRREKPSPQFDPVTLHVAGLPTSEALSPASLAALFAPFGQVVDVRFPRNQQGLLKGFAFVQYKDASSAKEVRKRIKDGHALTLPFEGLEHPLRVTAAVGVRPHKPVEGLEEFKHTVFVSNLSALTTSAHLEDFVRRIGAPVPVAIRMPTDRKTGESRCIAYLDFDDQSLVQQSADMLKDKMLDGRRLKAAPSAPTKARPSSTATDHAASSSGKTFDSVVVESSASSSSSSSTQKPLVPRSVAMRNAAPKQRLAIAKPAAAAPPPPQSSSQMDTS